MADPRYPLLESFYEREHRAQRIADDRQLLSSLRPRTHALVLTWDERFAPYLARAGFLDLASTVTLGLPDLDGPLLTSLLDRWRPETHSFHLPCGEMTVTLEDTAMILGLPLEGAAVTRILNTATWCDLVQGVFGVQPPEDDQQRSKKTSGVSSAWLRESFPFCPLHAEEAEVERHARVWLWHLVGGFLLADASGNTVTWSVLPLLAQPWENVATYSWGSAVLAWLYRQLCVACRRTAASASLGGCLYPLQVWAWEWLPIGRPHRSAVSAWNIQGCRPTLLYLWKNIRSVRGNPERRYLTYTNELDYVTQWQVLWTAYERPEVEGMELSPICTRDRLLWRVVTPLLFFHVVEWHLPCRVLRQFGRKQTTPPPVVSTDQRSTGASGIGSWIGESPTMCLFSGGTPGRGSSPTMEQCILIRRSESTWPGCTVPHASSLGLH